MVMAKFIINLPSILIPRFAGDHVLSCMALLKLSELTGRVSELKTRTKRAEAKALVNALAGHIIPRMNRLILDGLRPKRNVLSGSVSTRCSKSVLLRYD